MHRLSRTVRSGLNLVAVLLVALAVGLFPTGASASSRSVDEATAQPAVAAAAVPASAAQCPGNGFPTIRQGSHGSAVVLAQCLLNMNSASALAHPLAVDGDFGPLTDAATRSFQRCVQIQVDGVIGPQTWNNLIFWADRLPWHCP